MYLNLKCTVYIRKDASTDMHLYPQTDCCYLCADNFFIVITDISCKFFVWIELLNEPKSYQGTSVLVQESWSLGTGSLWTQKACGLMYPGSFWSKKACELMFTGMFWSNRLTPADWCFLVGLIPAFGNKHILFISYSDTKNLSKSNREVT